MLDLGVVLGGKEVDDFDSEYFRFGFVNYELFFLCYS